MLIIGSQAMKYWGILPAGREPRDTDAICTFEEFQSWSARIKEERGIQRCVPISAKKFHIRDNTGWNYEFEIAWEGSAAAELLAQYSGYAPLEVLYALKMSHRYLKDSPHFLKTMQDIQYLRTLITRKEERLAHSEWFAKREKETYVYNHPKLNVTKGEFFDDSVPYQYDHDTIHETVALMEETIRATYTDGRPPSHRVKMPAYTYYMQDGAQVMTDKAKFFSVEPKIRLYGVYEEACVLALERSQIPHNFEPSPRYSFELALMKVCTSITSGWFREFAWENYNAVLALYNQLGEDDYIERFKRNQHLLKAYKT